MPIVGLHSEMKKSNEKIEHIDYAIVAKTHPSRYLMHRYWARKPHNVVSEYIEHYSKEGDIVLDPFAGSGSTGLAAEQLDRNVVLIDNKEDYFETMKGRLEKNVAINRQRVFYEMVPVNV